MERINNGLVEMEILMDREDLLEFLKVHIETGDLFAILVSYLFIIIALD